MSHDNTCEKLERNLVFFALLSINLCWYLMQSFYVKLSKLFEKIVALSHNETTCASSNRKKAIGAIVSSKNKL